MKRSIVNHRSLLAALIVFVIAFALYLSTLAPTISWAHDGADGGDLITAAATLGVAHPPGYPTYITLGHLFAQLSIGNVAYRLNLMSAVCMASAAALTALTLIPGPSPDAEKQATGEGSTVGVGVGVLGGLTFAAAPMIWGQATIAEVHALNTLSVAAIVCLLAPIVFRGESIPTHQLILAFFLWGLGSGNLLTITALVPIMFLAWHRSRIARHRAASLRSFSLFTFHSSLIISFLLGLGIYLLVPLRAATHPPISWGNATTWPNFVAQVSAELYRGYVLTVPLNEYPSRLIAFAQLLVTQFGWFGVLLGAIGVWRAFIGPNKNWRGIMLTLALYTIFALGYNTPDSSLYLIPVWWFGAWAIAYGSLEFIQMITRLSFLLHPSSLILLLIILVPGLTIATNYASMNLSADRAAKDFARTVLTQAPLDAILITRDDAHTFTLWYYRLVESQRPDTTIIDARMAGYAWYDPMLIAQGQAPRLPDYDPQDTWLERLRAANPTRPICEIDAATANMQCKR
jgi:hypothetical protein